MMLALARRETAVTFSVHLVVLLGLLLAVPAAAEPVYHDLTFDQTKPSADTFVGSFVIDDSLLGAANANGFVPFQDFDSFSITVPTIGTFDLADAGNPALEGVTLDGAGNVAFFDSPGFDPGSVQLVEFCCSTVPGLGTLDMSETGGWGIGPFFDPLGRPDKRFFVDPFIGHGVGRFLLVAGEVEFLNTIGGIAKAAPRHHILMKIFVAMAHAADVERDFRFQPVQRALDIAVDVDVCGADDGEVVQPLVGALGAGAFKTFLEPGQVFADRCGG